MLKNLAVLMTILVLCSLPVLSDETTTTEETTTTQETTTTEVTTTEATTTVETTTTQETTTTMPDCSGSSDGLCPDGCTPASDIDCCTQEGWYWLHTAWGYDCYDQDYSPGCSPGQACSSYDDGCCPIWCGPGSDYDCCLAEGNCWYNLACYPCDDVPDTTSTIYEATTTIPHCPHDYSINTAEFPYGCYCGLDDMWGVKHYGYCCIGGKWVDTADQCETTMHCGNGICESGENCGYCPSDCPCPPDQYCKYDMGNSYCVYPSCGNNVCEPNENCPEDCGTVTTAMYSCSYMEGIICDSTYQECRGYYVASSDTPYCCIGECYKKEVSVCGNYACEPGEDSYNCPDDCVAATNCGNGVCEYNENQENCPYDCTECPALKECPDGGSRPCRMTSSGMCSCEPCNLPAECYAETDETGFVHIICEDYETVCPLLSREEKIKCMDAGGNPVIRRDSRGCEYVSCEFVQEAVQEGQIQIFTQYQCPSSEEIDEVMRKCEMMNQRGIIMMEGGCRVAKCISEQETICPEIPYEEKEQIKRDCADKGLAVIRNYDQNGCPILMCAEQEGCGEDPPEEAYRNCNAEGGELIVKKDSSGCVVFVECVRRGDENSVYVERIDRIPESGVLLEIAFKLENLKITLDKLVKQTEDIANYYASTGSSEEQRFRRVSDMFENAKNKVDEIKNKLRDRLEYVTVDDLMEIKHDIRYIKDVVIKDILYVMLSTSNDVKEIINEEEGNCGTNGECFDNALRVCKSIVFYPEGENGPKVEIAGLEDGKCKLYAILPEDQGPPAGMIPGINPPYDMTCFLPNYAMGARDPNTDILPYCEGPLMQLMTTYTVESGTSSELTPEGYISMDIPSDFSLEAPAGAKDCGSDDHCLYEAVSLCEPAKYEKMEQGSLTQVVIIGLENDVCIYRASVGDGMVWMDCKDPEYYRGLDEPYKLQKFCEGNLPDMMVAMKQQEIQIKEVSTERIEAYPVQEEYYQRAEDCAGCLDNGRCDFGECSWCSDCE